MNEWPETGQAENIVALCDVDAERAANAFEVFPSKTGSSTGANFGYSGPLTETVLLGTVAYRAGRKLEWDPVNLEATNCPEADAFIRRGKYRKGWTL